MWKNIQKQIQNNKSFLITTHINPDGDAIGSEVALKLFLEQIGKKTTIVNSSVSPDTLVFLDPEGTIKRFQQNSSTNVLDDIDVIFILDVNNWQHVGAISKVLRTSTLPRVCIDHHVDASEKFADVTVADASYASTGMMVYDLIVSMKGTVTPAMAEAVYATIIADTGTFRFSNTDKRAFVMAAELCDKGVNPHNLYRRVFASKTWGTGRLLGPVLGSVETGADGRLAWISATQEMFKTAGATYDDSDGFVDLVRAIKGVELVLFFKELPDGKIKVSLRSNGIADAHAIASGFGGGGHKMASGLKVDGPMEKAIETVVSACLQVDGIKDPPLHEQS
jgi:nanoRNase/pAp phosphatase (c-di-AMP/oligoRNAs hydrolase)